ncbi:MAG: TonB-dependent receptor [Marinifilaceae bacterium]|jgi:iron complex outermembrane receptor protein|nr:TonB-dependent receptor [Marinifilaceae bacterium]
MLNYFFRNIRKTSILVILILLSTSYSFSQFSIKGKITDAKSEILPGASVAILGSYNGTVSNSNGEFVFKNLKKANYSLIVSFVGYKKKTVELNLEKDIDLNIQLEKLSILSEEVVVNATRADKAKPFAKSNFNKKDIEDNNQGHDIPYQLSNAVSVVSNSEAGTGIGYSSMRIRGTDASRINFTINGIPLNDSESQNVFFVNMPDFASSLNSIQIQRGVGTSMNGAAAFGASVNFQTRDLKKDAYVEYSSLAGSFGTFRNSLKLGTGLLKNKLSIDLRLSKLDSDGYIDRGFSDHESMFANVSYYSEKSILKFNLIHGNQHTGITWWGNSDLKKYPRTYNPAGIYYDADGNEKTFDGQTDNYKQTHYQLFYTYKLSDFINLNLAAHYTKGKGYYQQYKDDDEYADYGIKLPADGKEESDLIRQKWLKNDFYGFTYSLDYKKSKLNLNFGGAANKYSGDHYGLIVWDEQNQLKEKYQWYFNLGEKTDINSYLKANYDISDKLNIYLDAQYRHIDYEMSGKDDDLKDLIQQHKYDFFNPKLGLSYSINDNSSMYFSYAIANREPNRADFKNAKERPNDLPKSEKLEDYELGYELRKRNFATSLNLYYMNYDNQLVATGELNSTGDKLMTNVKDSYRMGLEFTAGVNILKNLNWTGNMSLSRNMIKNHDVYLQDENWELYLAEKSVDKKISFSPELIMASSLKYTFKKNLVSELSTKYVGKQYIDNSESEERKLDAYNYYNFRLAYNFKYKFFKNISLACTVNNIFDLEYENNAYVAGNWITYFPQAGRHFYISCNFKL